MRGVPNQIINLVKNHQVLFSGKARHQLDIGVFDTDDLIHSVLYGKLVKKERDEQQVSRYKYTIVGSSRSGISIYSCGKMISLFKKAYFIITFHETR
ncbi:MAG: hypothetical protein AABY55_02815 [Candidatus Omnitrophota bacterium]